MSTTLFGKNIEPACKYCESAIQHVDEKRQVLCEKYGVVRAEYSCRKYVYDPTKRIPKQLKPLEKFDAEDFSLDLDDE